MSESMPNTAPEAEKRPEKPQNASEAAQRGEISGREKTDPENFRGTPLSVAVGVLRQGDTVLMEKRHDAAHQGGLWAFPGGKVAAGEGVDAALVREFREETGLETDGWRPLIEIPWDYGDRRVRLHVFQTERFGGTPRALAATALEWRAITDLVTLPMPPANRGIVAALQLPPRLAITGRFSSSETLYAQVVRLLSQGHRLILWRAPWLSRGEYVGHARQLIDLAHRHGARLLLHGDPSLLHALPQADGVHLPSRFLPHLTGRWLPRDKWLGASCHDAAQLRQAALGEVDYALLSPIRSTASHPDVSPIGWERAAALVAEAPMPVYALGGLDEGALDQARTCGFQGIAAISAWWSA